MHRQPSLRRRVKGDAKTLNRRHLELAPWGPISTVCKRAAATNGPHVDSRLADLGDLNGYDSASIAGREQARVKKSVRVRAAAGSDSFASGGGRPSMTTAPSTDGRLKTGDNSVRAIAQWLTGRQIAFSWGGRRMISDSGRVWRSGVGHNNTCKMD